MIPRMLLLPLALAVAALPSSVGAQQPRPATPRAAAGGVMRMRQVRILDEQGWGQPVEVARLLIPSDWQVEGGVTWAQGMSRCPQNIVQLRWQAHARDGLTGFEILPQYSWVWSDDQLSQQTMYQSAANNMACDANPLVSPADFLARMVLPRVRQGSRVVGAEPMQGLAQAEQQKMMGTYGPMVQQGLLRGVRAEAGRVRAQYQVGNQPVEEWISATIATIAAPTANSAALMNGGVAMTASSFQVTAYNVVGTWAPREQLDQNAKLFATILTSLRGNPQYAAAVGAWLRNIANIQRQGAMDRQKIWREAQDYISNSIQQTYRENQVVQDRMAEQFGQTIRGVETYVDPRSNERVELVGGYVGAWSNGKGEYILSDSPNFNPATELHEDWREMKKPR